MHAKHSQTERPIFREWVHYDDLTVVPNQPITVYVLENANISPNAEPSVKLEGTWMVVTDGFGQYGHFLREGVGAFLYCRTIFPDLQPLFMRVLPSETNEQMRQTIDMIFDRMSCGLPELRHYEGSAIHQFNFRIERLVVMLDNGRLLTSRSHPNFWECRTPHIASCLRDYFSDLMIEDETAASKIFVTRRQRNAEIAARERRDDPWYRNRFVDEDLMGAVEQAFSDHGYEIVDFGEMAFPDQVRRSYNAGSFAGFLGTAFHNGIWCQDGSAFYGVKVGSYGFDWEHDIIHTVAGSKYSLIDVSDADDPSSARAKVESYIK